MKKIYEITKKCFVGEVGDLIKLTDGMDGIVWENMTQRKIGCPFVEFDCVLEREVEK